MRLPNPHFLALRVLGRPTCVMAPGSRLLPSARIMNPAGPDDRIVIGAHSIVAGELMAYAHGGTISIGEWCFVGPGTRIWAAGSIHIGNRVLISHNVNVFDNLTHPVSATARHAHTRAVFCSGHPRELDLDEKPVHIGDDAWICAGSTVLRGITIGKASIVAAASVVTRDVPDGCVVAGNPAQIVRELTEAERAPPADVALEG